MKNSARTRLRASPGLGGWRRYRVVFIGIALCLVLYWMAPMVTFASEDCKSTPLPRFEGDRIASEWQLWDHRSVGRPTGVSVLLLNRVVREARVCGDYIDASEQSQISIIHVSSRGSASLGSRTQEVMSADFALALGDVVAHQETIYALVYASSPQKAKDKPHALLRLADNGQQTEVAKVRLPSAEYHSLLAVEAGPLLVSYSTSCTSHFAVKRLLFDDFALSLSLPHLIRITDFVRAGRAHASLILQGANCQSGLDESVLCVLDPSPSCTLLDLPPGATVRYYHEVNNKLVFSAQFGTGSTDSCWQSSPANVRSPLQVEDPTEMRLCECGSMCVASSRTGIEVHAYVLTSAGVTYDSVSLPVTPPNALGWPAAQFPSVSLASFMLMGPSGEEEIVRVWRGAKREAVTLSQAVSIECKGSDVVALQTGLVPFPAPHFHRLMPGDYVRCSTPRRFTHISSPAFPALALTFVGGPSPSVRELLPVLRELGVRATFFVLGENVMLYPDLLQLIALEGHDIGVQSMHAQSLADLSASEVEREIAAVLGYVRGITGARPCLIRPPRRRTSDEVESVIELFALSSSYPTTVLPADGRLLAPFTHSFDGWPALVFPYRGACAHQCRGAVLELPDPLSKDVNAMVHALRLAVAEMRTSKLAQFVRVTGETFPAFEHPPS